jgi:SDR family mycofactocin-dependent oxidoreductase
MPGRVDGKVVFITGVARGQGRAHAVRLAEEGADIVGLDLCAQVDSVDYAMSTEDDLLQTVKLVEDAGRKIVARVGDVRDISSIQSVYEEGLQTFGHIDCVIANAGIMPVWGKGSDTMQAWHDSLDILLTGVLNTIEVAYPRLLEQGTGGSVVITSSMAAAQPMMRTLGGRTLGLLGYSAAKAAVINLAENYASILAYHGIRVNTVLPTGVSTPMAENDMVRDRFETANPEDLLALVNAIPVNFVDADDVANAALWLCSDESRYFTGSAMRIDAGASLR